MVPAFGRLTLVRAEASIADENGALIPAKIDECQLPVMFRVTQTADLSRWGGEADDKAWQAFIGDVRRKVGSAIRSSVGHAQVPVEAQETVSSGGSAPFVALLPITYRAGDAEMEILAEDLTEDITRELAQNSFFKVIGGGTMATWRGKSIDHKRLGHEFEISYLIEGKLQRSGENVRLTVQLIDSATGGMLRSDRHVRSLAEIEAAPEEFSVAIASELGEHITQIEGKRAIEKQGPLSGWDHFMRAVALMERLEPESITSTIAEVRKAVAAAPDLGLAHALAVRSLMLPAMRHVPPMSTGARRPAPLVRPA
jgi:TolB-like protein